MQYPFHNSYDCDGSVWFSFLSLACRDKEHKSIKWATPSHLDKAEMLFYSEEQKNKSACGQVQGHIKALCQGLLFMTELQVDCTKAIAPLQTQAQYRGHHLHRSHLPVCGWLKHCGVPSSLASHTWSTAMGALCNIKNTAGTLTKHATSRQRYMCPGKQ